MHNICFRIRGIRSPCAMALLFMFVVMLWWCLFYFTIDGRVFMLSGVMHIPNVVSSLFGCFRV